MKNITILSILFTLAFFSSDGQIAVLGISNPFPRIGDECEIGYTLTKDTSAVTETQSLKDQLNEIRDKNLGSGTFKFTKMITDTGINVFGPFAFIVNDRTIKSDVIKLQFDHPLPDEATGIWARQRSYQGQEYLIIEQRISGEWITTKTSNNSTSSEFKKESEDFVEVDNSKIEDDNIQFEFTYSSSKSQEVVINGKNATVSYKVSLYKIKKKGSLGTTLKLDKTNLKFLSKKQRDFEFNIH